MNKASGRRHASNSLNTYHHQTHATLTTIKLTQHLPPSNSLNTYHHQAHSTLTTIKLTQLLPPSSSLNTYHHQTHSTLTTIRLTQHLPPSSSLNTYHHQAHMSLGIGIHAIMSLIMLQSDLVSEYTWGPSKLLLTISSTC